MSPLTSGSSHMPAPDSVNVGNTYSVADDEELTICESPWLEEKLEVPGTPTHSYSQLPIPEGVEVGPNEVYVMAKASAAGPPEG